MATVVHADVPGPGAAGLPDRDDVVRLYRRRAPRYDLSSHLYWLLAYPLDRYRREAVEALRLAPGDTVVELGCGTGHNLPLLRDVVGAEGRVVGVDLTDAMLARARERVARAGWSNVELVNSDAAAFAWPARVDGVLSTYALPLVRELDAVVGRAAAALGPGKRMAVVDLTAPEGWPRFMVSAMAALVRPFGAASYLHRHPWDSMRDHFAAVELRRRYLGTTCLAVGEKAAPSARSEP